MTWSLRPGLYLDIKKGSYVYPHHSGQKLIYSKWKSDLEFPELLRKLLPKGLDEENVSYDVEALFTNIPIDMTIDYIIDEIYEIS